MKVVERVDNQNLTEHELGLNTGPHGCEEAAPSAVPPHTAFQEGIYGQAIVLMVDSTTVVAYVSKQVGDCISIFVPIYTNHCLDRNLIDRPFSEVFPRKTECCGRSAKPPQSVYSKGVVSLFLKY